MNDVPIFFKIGDSDDIYVTYYTLDGKYASMCLTNGYQQVEFNFDTLEEFDEFVESNPAIVIFGASEVLK